MRNFWQTVLSKPRWLRVFDCLFFSLVAAEFTLVAVLAIVYLLVGTMNLGGLVALVLLTPTMIFFWYEKLQSHFNL